MAKADSLTAARLREVLHYDPHTGVFTWAKDTGGLGKCKAGSIAGSLDSKGYICIGVDNGNYRAHRLAWLYMTGEWPACQVDHKNTVRHDNRFDNLREATDAQNQQNRRRAPKTNLCGLLGVSKNGKRWKAMIRYDGKYNYLGTFDTPELAHAAYIDAKVLHHPFQTIVEKS